MVAQEKDIGTGQERGNVPISLVQDQEFNLLKVGIVRVVREVIQEAAGRADENLHTLTEGPLLRAVGNTTWVGLSEEDKRGRRK